MFIVTHFFHTPPPANASTRGKTQHDKVSVFTYIYFIIFFQLSLIYLKTITSSLSRTPLGQLIGSFQDELHVTANMRTSNSIDIGSFCSGKIVIAPNETIPTFYVGYAHL